MQLRTKLEQLPDPIIDILKFIREKLPFANKYNSEFSFWKSRLEIDKGKFDNRHYEKLLLAMAEEKNDSFLSEKIVADFGCGPRGSLVWAKSTKLKIGIDVLVNMYADEFKDNIISHDMIYLQSTEKVIPLPSNFVDIMFTLNAIDHVYNFKVMCDEIIRVIKPGGEFIGSFNLEEPVTSAEPQSLNEQIIMDNLLYAFDIVSYRITKQGPRSNKYLPFFENKLHYEKGEKGILWVRARKN